MNLGRRLGRLLVGHARRLGKAGLDRARAQRGDGDTRAVQLGTRARARTTARRPSTRRSRPVRAAAGRPRSTRCSAPRRRCRVTMPGTNRVHRSTTASTLVRTSASSAARSAVYTGPIVVKPALLTRMSAVRPRASSCAGSAPRESASVRSAAMTSARTAWACASSSASALQAVLAPGHQGQAVAASRQLSCDLRPDARRCAGDDRGRVLLGCRQCHDESVGDRARRHLGVVDVVRSRAM